MPEPVTPASASRGREVERVPRTAGRSHLGRALPGRPEEEEEEGVATVGEADQPGAEMLRLGGVVRPVRQPAAAVATAAAGTVGLRAAAGTAVVRPATSTTATAGWGTATAEELLLPGAMLAEGRTTAVVVDGRIGSVLWRASMASMTRAAPRKR